MFEIVSPRGLVCNRLAETGRYAVSTTTICRGDVILVDLPLDIAIDEEHRESHCFSCGRGDADMHCCMVCKKVYFCQKCSHRVHVESGECEVMLQYKYINESEMPVQCILAFRLLLKHAGSPDRPGCTQSPSDVTRINPFDLVGHYADNDSCRMEMAGALTRAVYDCADHIPAVNVATAFDELPVRNMLQVIRQNAFRFQCGLALFPLCALLNHSCAPTAVMTMDVSDAIDKFEDGDVAGPLSRPHYSATVRCLQSLSVGDEITISYNPLGLLPSSVRQELMLNSHDFHCRCSVCICNECDALLLSEVRPPASSLLALSLDPLQELLDMAEAEMVDCEASFPAPVDEADSGQSDDGSGDALDRVFFFLNQAEFGCGNMGLQPCHYMRLRRLTLLVEACLLANNHAELVMYATQWIGQVKSSSLQHICDAHLMCRMLVLQAESLVELYESENALNKTRELYDKVVAGLDYAAEHAGAMYGNDYAMVSVLQQKKCSMHPV